MPKTMDVETYEALSILFQRIHKNRERYRENLEKIQVLPDDQRISAEEKAYKDSVDAHERIIKSYAGYYTPQETAKTIEDYIADIGRDALIAMVLEALKEPLFPDTVLGRDELDFFENDKLLELEDKES